MATFEKVVGRDGDWVSWYEIIDIEAAKQEGAEMQNAIPHYFSRMREEQKDARFFTLRDQDMRPYVTAMAQDGYLAIAVTMRNGSPHRGFTSALTNLANHLGFVCEFKDRYPYLFNKEEVELRQTNFFERDDHAREQVFQKAIDAFATAVRQEIGSPRGPVGGVFFEDEKNKEALESLRSLMESFIEKEYESVGVTVNHPKP
jgi:hypothetical protein